MIVVEGKSTDVCKDISILIKLHTKRFKVYLVDGSIGSIELKDKYEILDNSYVFLDTAEDQLNTKVQRQSLVKDSENNYLINARYIVKVSTVYDSVTEEIEFKRTSTTSLMWSKV